MYIKYQSFLSTLNVKAYEMLHEIKTFV